ncbi:MAG: hypothetical protein CL916_03040 [Deltaproteobacteria bacterium]|nr:hypothetical protein [Deltaproteobacteria bacterium]
MTKTQQLLQNHLIIVLAPLLLNACGEKQTDTGVEFEISMEEGTYYLNIEEDADCPSLNDVNENLPEQEFNCSGQRFIEVTELIQRYDYPHYIDGPISDDPNEDPEGDHCTYKGNYEPGPIPDWCMSVGRPMLRDGEQISAKSKMTSTQDWQKHTIRVKVEGLSVSQRKIAGNFYLRNALMEHASVAAFHHFSLELMKFGAPVELLELAHEAITDELRHAKQAFSLAADLLGETREPSSMPMELTLSKNLIELAETVAREAAINETLAVLIAAEQRKATTDPAIQLFLEGVIRDESRHAELAWKTLRWCIDVGGEDVRNRLREIMMEEPNIGSADFPEVPLLTLGLCSRKHVNKAIEQGMRRVVRPSFVSLLNT